MNDTDTVVDKPTVEIIGHDGNAFAIMGACRRAWKASGRPMKVWDETIYPQMVAGSYHELLNVVDTYFDIA